MKFFLICVISIIILLMSVSSISACSFNEFIPFNFNSNEYVFFGKVVGYTDRVETLIENNNRKITFNGYGVLVKVESSVYLPKDIERIEVFVTVVSDTACTPKGLNLDDLEKDFPINTDVRVIGQENKSLLGNNPNSIVRIQVSGGNQGQLFKNLNKKGIELTTTESIFNYKLSRPLYDTKFTIAENFVWLFELRKDLKRLKQAKSEDEKYLILKRLAYAYDNYLDYGNLLKEKLSDKQKQKELLRIKKNWEKQKFS